MISRETATRIAQAHAEIEAAEKLLAELAERANQPPRDPRHGFNLQSDQRYGIELGVRVGSGMRCYDVSPKLAIAVITAHIANKRDELGELSALAHEEAMS